MSFGLNKCENATIKRGRIVESPNVNLDEEIWNRMKHINILVSTNVAGNVLT